MVVSAGRFFTAACALAGSALALSPLEVDGKDFVNSKTKERFQIIGVDYQPGGTNAVNTKSDPLTDSDACMRDAALMQRLGINTIRIYNMQPTLNHDKCVSIFSEAGIYMILDVNSPLANGSLNRAEPWTTYDAAYFEQVFGIIEAFKNYENVLGFFAGNEVINQDSTWLAPAYVRAVVRDMKNYIAKNAPRTIPVGYSAADVSDILTDTAHYFECEMSNSTNSRIDFFGLNSYSWCGDASYTSSGYDVLTEDFANATVPVFFSEYGCNKVTPRTFTEVQALYGEEMTQAFSGGLVYEWTQETNDYGLVMINNTNTVTTLIDYDNLQKQFNELDIGRIMKSNGSQTSVKAETCSPSIITSGKLLNSWGLPATPSKVSDYIESGLPNAPTGSFVAVSGGVIPQKVYDYTGKEITGVEFKVLTGDEANTPSGNSSSSSTGTSSSSSSTGTSTHNAASLNGPSVARGGLGGLFMLLASLL
ncbi:CAZyme family GH72 [Penicillium cinerascens]|uniref:1,3-beta-glucanosyltransferase n=1 Tax=Penicillium cinerascens TaxID=70096 RepID=A0A9W9MAC5_9EURO|nr:CAZyme family GH72 [Penicillium cinerascens]KAJ5194544.1 CAZyme family GH72 [Penicillium cinerascens]